MTTGGVHSALDLGCAARKSASTYSHASSFAEQDADLPLYKLQLSLPLIHAFSSATDISTAFQEANFLPSQETAAARQAGVLQEPYQVVNGTFRGDPGRPCLPQGSPHTAAGPHVHDSLGGWHQGSPGRTAW